MLLGIDLGTGSAKALLLATELRLAGGGTGRNALETITNMMY